MLHGIGAADGDSLIEVRDSLIADPGKRWSVVLSNPPFGKKSSLTMVGADGRGVREDREIERQDFAATTSNARPGQLWTERLWVYDLRTNKHFTLKQNPLRRADLDDFVTAYKPEDRGQREESERWKSFTYDEITARDKANLDVTWLRDESLEDLDNLPSPEILAREIVEDLSAALAEFEAVAAALEEQLSQPH